MVEQSKSIQVHQHTISVHDLGVQDYQSVWQKMVDFTNNRDAETKDEIWFVQHPAVYTQGTTCTSSTLLPTDIPVVKTDRGGQITYHGEGQIVMYTMLQLKRYKLSVSKMVRLLEQAVIDLLLEFDVQAHRKDKAPGVYIDGAKISALGLRIRKGCSYHGLSLNVDMDLSPFSNIDPCGYKGLEVVSMAGLGLKMDIKQIEIKLLRYVSNLLKNNDL